jgi:hypothetical protein
MDKESKNILLRNLAEAYFQLGILAAVSFVFTGILSTDTNKIIIVIVGGSVSTILLAIAISMRTLYKIK